MEGVSGLADWLSFGLRMVRHKGTLTLIHRADRIDEALGARLATLHNLRFYLRLLEDTRAAILAGSLEALRGEIEATSGHRDD